MKIFANYIKETGSFNPISNDDYRKSLKIKDGSFILIETWQERNVMFHRKYFALLNCTIQHMPEDPKFDIFRNIESLRREIMMQSGRVDIHETLGGKITYHPHSISFKSMDNENFEGIYSEAINIILKYFLKHITEEDFENDILNFL